MTVDMSLTSIIARERIGNLVVGNDDYRDLLRIMRESDTLRDLTREFQLEYKPDVYDLAWTFSLESRLVKAVKQFYDIEKEQGVGSTDERSQGARIELHNAFGSTAITSFLYTYDMQMSGLDRYLRMYDLFEESGAFFSLDTGQSVREGLINAIEHGSKFGEKGDVRLKFLGGEEGALVLIEDPSEGFNLQPRSPKELEHFHAASGYDYGKPSQIRGAGLQVYTQTEKAIIGSEQEEGLFRLIVLYPIPEKDKLEAYVNKVRKRWPPEPDLTTLEGRLDYLWQVSIDELPWEEVEKELATGKRAYRNRTKHLLYSLDLNIIGNAFIYFKEGVEKYGRPPKYKWSPYTEKDELTYIGKRSYEIIREVFKRVGLELPKARF